MLRAALVATVVTPIEAVNLGTMINDAIDINLAEINSLTEGIALKMDSLSEIVPS